MRASHSSCEWQVRVGISGGWSTSHAPVAGSSWTTSRSKAGLGLSISLRLEAWIARPLRTCISSRCDPSGVTSSKSTTHSSPSRRARSSRSRAISLPRSRVSCRWRWQKAASRRAPRSITARMLGAVRDTTSVAMSRRSCHARASSSAIARTVVTYCSYSAALIITDGYTRDSARRHAAIASAWPAPTGARLHGPGVQLESLLPPGAQRGVEDVERVERRDALHEEVLGEAVERAAGEAAGVDRAPLVEERLDLVVDRHVPWERLVADLGEAARARGHEDAGP